MKLTKSENYFRAMDRQYPEWIPCWINIAYDTWMAKKEELKPLIAEYPHLFENASSLQDESTPETLPKSYAPGIYKDAWDCV